MGGGVGAKAAPEVLDRLGQPGLIVLDRQHVVGPLVANGLGDGDLRAHGVDGDRASGQRQGGKLAAGWSSAPIPGSTAIANCWSALKNRRPATSGR